MISKPSIAVIGLGIVGSSIAAHLSEQGYRTTGFEQFAPAHNLGSSHGENRLFRRVPAEGEKYVEMAARAIELWPHIEKKSGRNLLQQNGCMDIAAKGQNWAALAYDYARKYDVACERLTVQQAKEKLPLFKFENGMEINFVPDSGILKAEESILAFQDIALKNGAALYFETEIVKIDFLSKTVYSHTHGTQKFDHIIIATGAWLRDLVPSIEVQIEKSVLGWYQSDMQTTRMPGFSFKNEKEGFYGMPGLEGNNFKIGPARQFLTIQNLKSKQSVEKSDKELLNKAITTYTQNLHINQSRFDSGKITHRPDGHFYIERHSENSDVLIFSPCSGHGFKYAPVYGEIAEEMIL